MFTGLVELLCPVIAINELDASKSGGSGFSITIGVAGGILNDCNIGDSIAVNGACLTVTEFDKEQDGGYFKVGAAPETLQKTNLGKLNIGDKVNCERAMAAHTRFGGHFVQGHVDTTATLLSIVPTGNALTLTLRLDNAPGRLPSPSSLSPYLIPKGYVTLDGASLTLIDVSSASGGPLNAQKRKVSEEQAAQDMKSFTASSQREVVEFTVMLIAHTQEIIGLPLKKPGDTVNIELDMVGKYVHRAVLGSMSDGSETSQASEPAQAHQVDAGRVQDGAQQDALERMIERVVRRVLAEDSER
ncbi:Lumazine-binding protein [Tilletiaria anomala UBC 951]|uniref:Lumazine-binding protein n=1 Tax=Tilletiaria anomala (strain ATCC 24038 / CBS 436.72 / UBC 951) TaxID=1037660 RepID=A0A066W6F8_TILAU|nr:Lumazine-binding protein [Tilletiaria anomala UBC 951]KDN49552.1 Lumazine-binding protein [Tilletiaria anomala UBC 951]